LGSLSAPPDPLAAIGGLFLRGWEGKKRGGESRGWDRRHETERREWDGRGKERRGREGKGGELKKTPMNVSWLRA